MRIMEPGKIYHTVYIDFIVHLEHNHKVSHYEVWLQLTEDSLENNPIRLNSDTGIFSTLKAFEVFIFNFVLAAAQEYPEVKTIVAER